MIGGEMKGVFLEDLDAISGCSAIPWDELRAKTVLVTGATGLLGSWLVKALLHANDTFGNDTTVLACVRSTDKFEAVFSSFVCRSDLLAVVGDICELKELSQDVDYIFHCASVTQSESFVVEPVDVFKATVFGTDNILRLATQKAVRSMVYVSSMEVYGVPFDSETVTEEEYGYLNPLATRSSYSESKRSAETLCSAYGSQFGLPVKIARPTLTFGPGVSAEDNRVFAQFGRCAINGEDIVLHTLGETRRDYLYIKDAICALLIMLLRGVNGEAYNIANADTYVSIREMADLVARSIGPHPVGVVTLCPEKSISAKYAPTVKVGLDTRKLQALGWRPTTDLLGMYQRMVRSWRESGDQDL